MIGITSYNFTDKAGFKGIGVDYNYIEEINKQGEACVVIPTHADLNTIDELAEQLEGLILTGGEDLSPCWFDMVHTREIQQTDFNRDVFEMALYRAFKEKGKPILGICRGMQLMAVLNGAELIQDLSREMMTDRHDFEPINPSNKVHKIKVEGEFFKELFGVEEIYVNSFHHQGIETGCKELKECLTMDDWIVEAFVNEEVKQMGFQWNPEMIKDRESEKIFKKFVEWCKGD